MISYANFIGLLDLFKIEVVSERYKVSLLFKFIEHNFKSFQERSTRKR